MNIPGTLDQVVLFVLFVLPGITFSTVRVSLIGWRAPDYGTGARILEALFVSAIFDGVYALLLGGWIIDQAKATPNALELVSQVNVLVALLLLIVLPALVSWGVWARPRFGRRVDESGKQRTRFWLANNYKATPQAWDFKVLNAEPQRVRVRTEDGIYYGGWFAGQSLASTYPHGRDLFIESQWNLDKHGRFISKVEDTRGVWIPITDKTIVEWIAKPTEEKP